MYDNFIRKADEYCKVFSEKLLKFLFFSVPLHIFVWEYLERILAYENVQKLFSKYFGTNTPISFAIFFFDIFQRNTNVMCALSLFSECGCYLVSVASSV